MVSIATDAMNALRRAHSERSGDVDLRVFLFRFPELDDDELADLIELDARERLRAGLSVELPRYLEAIPDLPARRVALDAAIEFALRSLSGSRHTKIEAVEALCEAYPDLVPAISAAWFLNDALGSTTGATALVQQPVALQLPASIGPLLPSGKHRYDLRERVGVGSHGSVYLAVDHALSESDRPAWVAVKVIPALNASHALAHRVMEEATKARRVLHPNIARVLDRGPMDGGGEFIVYEHVDGGDLQSAHDRGRLPSEPRSLAGLVAKIARAVQAAHSAGLIHSDLKPSNILLTSAGEPKVGDFGLAARRFDLGENAGGVQLGTLGFIAPERYRAEPGSEGIQSDVYSLGGILYYLLTGKSPNGDTADEVADRFGADSDAAGAALLEPLRDVDPDLAAICARALAHRTQDRYPSADAFAADLEAWLDYRPLAWRRPKPAKLIQLFCRRNPLLTSAGTLLVITLVGAAGAFVQVRSNQRQRLMQAALDRAADIQNEQQRANQRVDQLVVSMMGTLKRDGEIEENWLPLLTITEAVAGPIVLDTATNADFQQLWRNRVNLARDQIAKAAQEGRQDDSSILLWRIGLGYWLLHDGDFAAARRELDAAGAVWAQRNGPRDTWTIYASTLAASAAIFENQQSLHGAPPSPDAAARIRAAADTIASSFDSLAACKNIRRQALLALTTAYSEPLLNRPDLYKKYDDILRPR
jgi:hypothetical protein